MNESVRNDEAVKACSRCGETKSVSEFVKAKKKKDGLRSECKECQRAYRATRKNERAEYNRKYRKENAASEYETQKAWRERNRDKCCEYSKRHRAKRSRFVGVLETSRYYAKRGDYVSCNATVEELEAAFTGKCEICGVPEQECTQKLHADHCHLTGNFRGFLCTRCNVGLGSFGDTEDLLIDALHYLMGAKNKQPIHNERGPYVPPIQPDR